MPDRLTNKRLLSLALEALYSERQKLDEEIADIEQQLGGDAPSSLGIRAPGASKGAKRRLSADGRKAISLAAKRRWAAFRKNAVKRSTRS